jgi:3-methyladenine DNA glycosylase AlkC
MELIDPDFNKQIQNTIIKPLLVKDYTTAAKNISAAIDELYSKIPDNKRISYGRVHTIKILSKFIFEKLQDKDAEVFHVSTTLFNSSDDINTRGVALGVISYIGLKDFMAVLPYFETAAAAEHWDLREHAQMFFRKIIKQHPKEAQEYLIGLVKSKDPNIRRFVSETLRPVQENRWFLENPEYPLTVLRKIFKERAIYPRKSVGNNLSDLSRRRPEVVFTIIDELVKSGDKNSYWIAYRACRNLVKKYPERVFELLDVEEYKYKSNIFYKNESK